jgi:hypothetical protein
MEPFCGSAFLKMNLVGELPIFFCGVVLIDHLYLENNTYTTRNLCIELSSGEVATNYKGQSVASKNYKGQSVKTLFHVLHIMISV